MVEFLDQGVRIIVPDWVVDLESFRRWMDDEDVPEKARISYLENRVSIDMSKEQVFSHVLVKTKIVIRVGGLVETEQLGLFLSDGVRLSNIEANISVKPDGTFISQASIDEDRVRFVEGMEVGFLEVEGSPDMVLEVVSPTSVRKDTVVLRQSYWEAGVREYWLVNALEDPLTFDILRYTSRGYVATRKQQGWVRSAVFDKSFRLMLQTVPSGRPDYLFEMR
jgi:Uma2 family endonuclease